MKERTGIPQDEQLLVCSGKQLEDDKKMIDYDFGDGSTIFLCLRLKGGSEVGETLDTSKPRPFPKGAPKHKDICPICLDEGNSLKMSCGHPVCPSCLIDYAWNEVSSRHRDKLTCPTCKSEWSLQDLKHYGVADREEIMLLGDCLSKNYIHNNPDIANCPGCDAMVARMKDSDNRVRCRECRAKGKKDFCWHCLKPWKDDKSTEKCGNDRCYRQEMLNILQKAPLTTFQFLPSDITAPSKCACPECGSLIKLDGGCKHMMCKDCQTEFYFLCLCKKVGGKWDCGSYNTVCAVAPVQTKIPHKMR